MKSRLLLGKVLIAAGFLILLGLGVAHVYAAIHGTLRSFDDGGWRILLPFVGTLCLGGGIFLLALSGGGRKDV